MSNCATADVIEIPTASGKISQEHSSKRQNPESRNEGESTSSPNSINEGESTSSPYSKNTVAVGEKKGGSSRLKKLKTYFCFAAF